MLFKKCLIWHDDKTSSPKLARQHPTLKKLYTLASRVTYQFVFLLSLSIQANAISISRRGMIERPATHGTRPAKRGERDNEVGKTVQRPELSELA